MIKNALNLKDQKTAIADIMTQNLRTHEVMKILHVKLSKYRAQEDSQTSIIIINIIIFRQTNILIHEKLILQSMFHNVKIFYRDCLIIYYFNY